jgi:hypothetical protein
MPLRVAFPARLELLANYCEKRERKILPSFPLVILRALLYAKQWFISRKDRRRSHAVHQMSVLWASHAAP